MMLEELERRNYSAGTTRRYLRFVERFAQHFGKSPDKLGPDHLRSYQAYLLRERKLCPGTVENHVAALRFFFVRTLRRHEFREFLPYPKSPRKLPNILSQEEVARLINASSSLFQRTLLMVLYGTGMRRAEIARLKIAHIDSQRMVVHVIDGKGHKDRDLPLSPTLLDNLRVYWRWLKPRDYLFPPASIAIRSSPSATRPYGWRAPKKPGWPAFASLRARISFAMRGPRICSKPVPTCAPSSCCSAMRIWR
jgi:integrase